MAVVVLRNFKSSFVKGSQNREIVCNRYDEVDFQKPISIAHWKTPLWHRHCLGFKNLKDYEGN